jgi:hypothetical protein
MDARTQAGSQSGAGTPNIAPGGPSPARSRPWLGWVAAVGWAVVALLAAHRVAPRIQIAPLGAYAIGFGVVALGVLGTAWRCPPVTRRALQLSVVPCLALLWLSDHPLPVLEMAGAVTVCLLMACTLLGGAVGWAIEHPGHLVFVAIVSAAADVFSVFHPQGPSAAIAQSEVALSVLALPWPMLGTPFVEPFLGAGDIVFTALYVACGRKHALPEWRTAAALTLGFVVTMVAVIALELAVPALPFLGMAVVLAQPQARRPPQRDRARGYALAAAVVAVVAGLLLL